ASDPWLAESQTDQSRFAVHPPAIVLSVLLTLPISIGIAWFDWWFATRNGLGAFALVTVGILAALFGIFLLPLQSIRDLEKGISAWIPARTPQPLPASSSFPWQDKLGGSVFAISAITGVALICRASVQIGLLLLGAGYGAYRLYPVLSRLLAK